MSFAETFIKQRTKRIKARNKRRSSNSKARNQRKTEVGTARQDRKAQVQTARAETGTNFGGMVKGGLAVGAAYLGADGAAEALAGVPGTGEEVGEVAITAAPPTTPAWVMPVGLAVVGLGVVGLLASSGKGKH